MTTAAPSTALATIQPAVTDAGRAPLADSTAAQILGRVYAPPV